MKTLVFIGIIFTTAAFGQKDVAEALLPGSGTQWNEGSILLNDGTELNGLIQYDQKANILRYQQGMESRSLLARNVSGFEFLDSNTGKQRIFYSLSYEEANTSVVKPLFFEILFEFKTFSVISKVDPVEIEIATSYSQSPNGFTNATSRYAGFSITETIFLMDAHGKIEPYVRIVNTENAGLLGSSSKTKNKVLNKNLLANYTTPFHDKLVDFVKKNDLSFEDKAHLIKIFEYYSQLIAE